MEKYMCNHNSVITTTYLILVKQIDFGELTYIHYNLMIVLDAMRDSIFK